MLNNSLSSLQKSQIEFLERIISKKEFSFIIQKLKLTFHSLIRSYSCATLNDKHLHIWLVTNLFLFLCCKSLKEDSYENLKNDKIIIVQFWNSNMSFIFKILLSIIIFNNKLITRQIK